MPLKSGSQALPFDPVLVGQRFMEVREDLGLSKTELAAKCGYSSEQVRRIEKGEQAPGARLLAALAEAGGDIRGILLGAGYYEEIPEMEAIMAARRREEWRREAREWSRMRSDRRKKTLSDDEADLIDFYRSLDRKRREYLSEVMRLIGDGHEPPWYLPSGHKVSADRGGIASVGDINIGDTAVRRRKKK